MNNAGMTQIEKLKRDRLAEIEGSRRLAFRKNLDNFKKLVGPVFGELLISDHIGVGLRISVPGHTTITAMRDSAKDWTFNVFDGGIHDSFADALLAAENAKK